jgi:hypothetical protein
MMALLLSSFSRKQCNDLLTQKGINIQIGKRRAVTLARYFQSYLNGEDIVKNPYSYRVPPEKLLLALEYITSVCQMLLVLIPLQKYGICLPRGLLHRLHWQRITLIFYILTP